MSGRRSSDHFRFENVSFVSNGPSMTAVSGGDERGDQLQTLQASPCVRHHRAAPQSPRSSMPVFPKSKQSGSLDEVDGSTSGRRPEGKNRPIVQSPFNGDFPMLGLGACPLAHPLNRLASSVYPTCWALFALGAIVNYR